MPKEACKKACNNQKRPLTTLTHAHLSNAERLRLGVQRVYDSNQMQMAISLVLIANFVISIVQSELTAGMDDALIRRFDMIDMAFTVTYSVELAVNIYSHWFWPFFCSGWCWFDLIIVSISVFDTLYVMAGGDGSGESAKRAL